jgi:folate-dependent phosphoribosylglycinamide formyltransferase PurN
VRRVAVLTGSELRHRFVRKALALSAGIDVVCSVCESLEGSLIDRVAHKDDAPRQSAHLAAREQSERVFFGAFDQTAPDRSHPIEVPRGAINERTVIDQVASAAPDVIVSYGCSILREDFLAAFPHRILNVHLGLSPYYRGGGTNFWPLVNGEPEFVGVTFMHIDAGVDTGEIIHQMRASIRPGDDPHQIGNRLIADMVPVLAQLVTHFDALPPMPQPKGIAGREYKMRDLTEDAVATLYARFSAGLVDTYLATAAERQARAPIVENPALRP